MWSIPVPAGQTALPVPLAGQAPGLYLVQLRSPDAPAITWRLSH